MKKTISVVLAMLMALGLAACGKEDASSSSAPVEAPPVSSESQPPVEEEEPLESAFLTGLEKGADYPEGQRITAIMVNNIAESRPTSGLSEADILVEIVTEGGITRFMALFDDYKDLPRVGSVRSLRDQFLQLIIPFSAFVVHDGESTPTKQMLTDYDYHLYDLKPNTGATYRRDRPGMKSEFTEYTDGEHIVSAVENGDFDTAKTYNSPMFSFTPYNKEPRVPETPGEEVAIIHSASYRTLFNYDNATARYRMSMFNSYAGGVQETRDENNDEQLAFENVLVLFAPMTNYPGTALTKVDYYGGAGYLFTQGHYERVLWNKGGPHEPLRLSKFDQSGEVVSLNPGKTYLGMVDDDNLEAFDTALVSGTGAQTAAAGQTNANETETEDS